MRRKRGRPPKPRPEIPPQPAKVDDQQAEKRRFPRIEVQLTVDLRTTYIYTTAQAINLSPTGLFIRTPHPLPEGNKVEMTLHLPTIPDPIHVHGEVRWVRGRSASGLPPGMGVELTDLPEEDQKLLTDYLLHCPKNL